MSNNTVPRKNTGDTLSAAELNDIASSANSKQDALGFTPENVANKNIPNGYAGLDSSGKLLSSQWPAGIDEVIEYANLASFPVTGNSNIIYITQDTNAQYRWSGSAYIEIVASPGTTDSVIEGTTNKYFTTARVLSTLLTGIGFITSTAVIATDSIITALGKLQAQITALFKIPAGGSTGQVLAKTSNTDGDVGWVNVFEDAIYTLPIASATTLGGIKQGDNIAIALDGTISASIQGTNFAQTGSLPYVNITSGEYYGDSITQGYLTTGVYSPFPKRLTSKMNMDYATGNIRALSGTGAFTAAQSGYQYLRSTVPLTAKLITWMAGLNDVRLKGDNAATYSKIDTCLMAFLCNCILKNYTLSIATSITTTGIWGTTDCSSYGSKSQFDDVQCRSSSVSGSTLSYNSLADTIVIGTFTDDGTSLNALGGFDIYVDGAYLKSYSPTGLNDGVVVTTGDPDYNTIGRQPNAILVEGVFGSAVKIVTTSNILTIIDYIGEVAANKDCPPIMVGLSPKLTTAGYAITPANANVDIQNNVDAILKTVVTRFKGFPIAIVDVNAYYNNVNSADGIHPNNIGALQLADAFFSNLMGAIGLPTTPTNIDSTINDLRVGQGPQTTNGTNAYGAVLGNAALNNNTTGADNVAIGGFAGRGNTSGGRNVFIGRQCAFVANGNNGVYVGYLTGQSETGNNNTIIGANISSPDSTQSNYVILGDGTGQIRIMFDHLGNMTINGPVPTPATDVASTHKIPIIVNNTQYFLLATNS